jgi:DNA (cytosine-5)-methyltransferase 1
MTTRKKTITIVDLFCGAGGTSTGAIQAAEVLGYETNLTAVNHWERAVATHSSNHPGSRHYCVRVESLNPRDLFKEGEVDVLWGSPECTHHSRARGGKPINDQSRATAWCVTRWAEALRPRFVMVENVPEFAEWGPTDSNGRPIPERKGEIFNAWLNTLRALGYTVDHRVLVAANYGAGTTRRRLFTCAALPGYDIVWPDPTHSKDGSSGRPWVGADKVIDWSIKGASIFNRKRPLAPNTLRRIADGLAAGGMDPSIIIMENGSRRRSVKDPLPTITTAKGGAMALAQPYLIPQHSGGAPRPVAEPVPTIATAGAISLVEPFLVEYYGTGGSVPIADPVPTVTTRGRFALAQPVVKVDGKEYKLDILFRMLKPKELAAAQGFPPDYKFTGTQEEQIKQIGNAVPCHFSKALFLSMLTQSSDISHLHCN